MRPETMKAGVLTAYREPIEIQAVPMPPKPTGSQVLLKVDGCGICHSDIHLADGEQPGLPPSLPHIMGHEVGGYVYELGDQVKGHCSYCISGRDLLCTEEFRWLGTTIPGGYAEYVLVENERFMVKLGTDTLPREAAPFTDAAITGYGAVRKAIPYFDPESPVLALGIGAIGTYGLQYLKLMSGCEIIAVDVTAEKLEAALAWGATYSLDGNSESLEDDIMALAGGQGVCAAIDFIGTDKTVNTALAVTRAEGGVIQTGMAGGVARVDGSTNPRHWSVNMQFSLGASLKQLREVMALLQTGRIRPIAVDYRPLEEINEVHDDIRHNRVPGRIVVIP